MLLSSFWTIGGNESDGKVDCCWAGGSGLSYEIGGSTYGGSSFEYSDDGEIDGGGGTDLGDGTEGAEMVVGGGAVSGGLGN